MEASARPHPQRREYGGNPSPSVDRRSWLSSTRIAQDTPGRVYAAAYRRYPPDPDPPLRRIVIEGEGSRHRCACVTPARARSRTVCRSAAEARCAGRVRRSCHRSPPGARAPHHRAWREGSPARLCRCHARWHERQRISGSTYTGAAAPGRGPHASLVAAAARDIDIALPCLRSIGPKDKNKTRTPTTHCAVISFRASRQRECAGGRINRTWVQPLRHHSVESRLGRMKRPSARLRGVAETWFCEHPCQSCAMSPLCSGRRRQPER